MKAYLLAGGRGERLRPFTLTAPKCLVPIDGVPLLDIWLGFCQRAAIDEVLINVSHHADQVRQNLAGRTGPPRVHLVVESEPIGSAGTVLQHRALVEGEESFWVLYADNLTRFSASDMLATHRRHRDPMTIGLFHAPNPSAAGIVQLDEDGRIVAFEEKPAHPRGDLANAGVYLARPSLFEAIGQPGPGLLDFGLHVLPALAGRLHGHVIEQFHMDVGTPAALAAATAAWKAMGAGA